MNLEQAFSDMAIDIARYLEQNYGIKPIRIDIDNDGILISWYDGREHTITTFYNDYDEYKDDFILLKSINGIKKERYEFNNLNDVYQQIIYIIDHTKPRMLY